MEAGSGVTGLKVKGKTGLGWMDTNEERQMQVGCLCSEAVAVLFPGSDSSWVTEDALHWLKLTMEWNISALLH
ncbi:hypothetical protein E2C01_088347 [Portunus trituberculatus]|uniref:Uncharacterized protein n=1 Tax=Portunus trituberculatus TaxID=210409 RepID=A0A5B7JLN9_PORTR|nr:hypothetical protein [Portunus trituberculatus]